MKAQDQILRAAAEGGGGGFKTTDDLMGNHLYPGGAGVSKVLNSLSLGGTNLTTNISQHYEDPSKYFSASKINPITFIPC